jgi:hypothetical protein
MESMARPAVREFLGKHLLPKSVFMITWLKVARRAKLGREKASGGGGQVKLGVDPTLGVNLGPDVGGNVDKKEKVQLKATDFVWRMKTSLRRHQNWSLLLRFIRIIRSELPWLRRRCRGMTLAV